MIKLHPGQSSVYEDIFLNKLGRFFVVNCSRGWGKSYMAATAATTAVIELLTLRPEVPNKTVYIIAPTYDQVTDIYFPLLMYDIGIENYVKSASRDLGRFVFPDNVELRLLSYEAVERMRGKGAYFVVWDEVSSCKKGINPDEAWQSVVQPTIITRWSHERADAYGASSPGRALILSTPKGFNFFHTLHSYAEIDKDWKSYTYDYSTSPFLDADDIEKLRHMLDPVQFASEYLASFIESGNSVFYCFDRKKHVDATLPYFYPPSGGSYGEDVHLAIDFNVGLQCTSASAIRGNQVHTLDEFKGHPDTETLAKAIVAKYPKHKLYAYPDPSGKSRKTSAPTGQTDFTILQAHGINCYARDKAPPIMDSVAAVNRKLMSAAGDVDFLVHPRCSGTIMSLERTKWTDTNPNVATIDKSEGVEHFSDGIRYFIEYRFPILAGSKRASRGFGF